MKHACNAALPVACTVFATDEQLVILSRAKTCYVDGTFKLCKVPFMQVLMINAFVRRTEHAKQIPLLFVLMSGKKKKDYREVVKEILRLPPNQPSVKKITIDFERAMWSTFRKLLPKMRIMGCAFPVFSPGRGLAGFLQEKLKWRIKTKKMCPLGHKGKLRVKRT